MNCGTGSQATLRNHPAVLSTDCTQRFLVLAAKDRLSPHNAMSYYSFEPARCRFGPCGKVFQPSSAAAGPWQSYCCRECSLLDHGIGPEPLPSAPPPLHFPLATDPGGLHDMAADRRPDDAMLHAETRHGDRGAYIEPWRSPSRGHADVEGEYNHSSSPIHTPPLSRRASSHREYYDELLPERGRQLTRGRYRSSDSQSAHEPPLERSPILHDRECHHHHHHHHHHYHYYAGTHAQTSVTFVPVPVPVVPIIPIVCAIPALRSPGPPVKWYTTNPYGYWGHKAYTFGTTSPPLPYMPQGPSSMHTSASRAQSNRILWQDEPSFGGGSPPFAWGL
ncbi:hypothetical protein BC628DRAFT_1371957 [Trametes gibbosa]|nr:hypothetical protein BC628DRAFT_1371957 [Trametes gibbosa]